jgi:type II secretory pathway pseudopilin PulG
MSVRDRAVIAVVGLVAAILAPWLLVIQPKRDQASKLQTQINAVQSQLAGVRTQLAAGNQARQAFAGSYSALIKLGEAVPTDDNTPSLIYQLQSAAKSSGVDFQGLTFNAGSGGSTAPTPSPPLTKGGSSTSGSSTSGSSTSGSSTSGSSTASASSSAAGSSAAGTTAGTTAAFSGALPPGATIGPAGFPVEPFTFTFQGNFFHLADFLQRLQKFVVANNQKLSVSGRLMTLNAITLAPNTGGFPEMTATINATTYLLPAAQGLLNGATPAGPATSTTQTVSNSSPTSSTPPAVVTDPVR